MFTKTVYLPKGYRLTLTTDAVSSGSYGRIGNPGDNTSYGRAAIAASSSVELGSFNEDRYYQIEAQTGSISDSQQYLGLINQDNVDINGGTIGGATIDAALVTSIDVGTKNGSTVTCVENGNGVLHKTVLTLASTPLSVVSVTTGNGVGGVKLYDMPAGYIKVLGCTADLSIAVETEADFTDGTPEGDLGIGTVAPANADALGTDTTDDNIGTATAFTMSAYAATCDVPPDGDVYLDGTSTAVDVYLNALVDAADIDDDTTTNLLVSGTVTLVWVNLGDY